MPDGQDPWCPGKQRLWRTEKWSRLEYALANSMNTVTAKLIKDYGVDRVVELAHAMGIRKRHPCSALHCIGRG